MGFLTNRGAYLEKEARYRSGATFHIHLCTNATPPTRDTNTLSQLTQIANGNGYNSTTGVVLTGNSTDFPALTENDSADQAEIQVRAITITASGGTIPPSGSGAWWIVLTDDHATPGSRQVLYYRDMGGVEQTRTDGNSFSIPAWTLRSQQ